MTAVAKKSTASGRLKELEARIEKTAKAVWDMAEALKEIREDELWKETHGSWTSYCEDRWGIQTEWARVTIAALNVRAQLGDPNSSRGGGPAHVKQASELARIPENDRPAVWEDAKERAAKDGKKEPSLHRHLTPAMREYRERKKRRVVRETPEERATREAMDAASQLRSRAEAFVASVENMLETRGALPEHEAQSAAYTIVSTLHNVALLMEEAGVIQHSVASGVLSGLDEEIEDQEAEIVA